LGHANDVSLAALVAIINNGIKHGGVFFGCWIHPVECHCYIGATIVHSRVLEIQLQVSWCVGECGSPGKNEVVTVLLYVYGTRRKEVERVKLVGEIFKTALCGNAERNHLWCRTYWRIVQSISIGTGLHHHQQDGWCVSGIRPMGQDATHNAR